MEGAAWPTAPVPLPASRRLEARALRRSAQARPAPLPVILKVQTSSVFERWSATPWPQLPALQPRFSPEVGGMALIRGACVTTLAFSPAVCA